MVNKANLLCEGKAKKVYWSSERDKVWIEFSDNATVFDGEKREAFEGKGALNAAISTNLFEYLDRNGIPNHYCETLSPTDITAEAVRIIPVEVVIRNITAGSLAKRMGVKEGISLDTPVIEFYYKSEELHNPMINEYHIESFDLADAGELKTIKDYCLDINSILSFRFSDIGLTLVDLKLEFGTDKCDQVILADEISLDTFRVWDAQTGDSMDKDLSGKDAAEVKKVYEEVLRRLQGGNA